MQHFDDLFFWCRNKFWILLFAYVIFSLLFLEVYAWWLFCSYTFFSFVWLLLTRQFFSIIFDLLNCLIIIFLTRWAYSRVKKYKKVILPFLFQFSRITTVIEIYMIFKIKITFIKLFIMGAVIWLIYILFSNFWRWFIYC